MEQDSLFRDAFGRTPECLPFEELVERMHARDETALRHLATCPHCAIEFKLYTEFMEGVVLPEDRKNVRWVAKRLTDPSRQLQPAISWWSTRHLIPATLAVAAAAMLVTIGVNNYQGGSRMPVADSVERSRSVDLVAPKGDLDSPPQVFRWNAVPTAIRYRVKLMEVDKTVLWESTVSSPSVSLPPAVERLVLPGKRLLWAVEAMDAVGRVVATGVQDFRRQVKHDR